MQSNNYKGLIFFPKGYNRSFGEFKEEIGSTHVFKNMLPEVREKELKKAYKIAIGDGDNQGTVSKSKKNNERKIK